MSSDAPFSWVPHPEPTNVIALWPGTDAPTADVLRAGLSNAVRLGAPPAPPECAWAEVWQLPGRSTPIAVWVEPARPLGPGDPDDAASRAAQWAVGLETELDPADPIADFSHLLVTLARAWSTAPAFLDVNTARWYDPAELAREEDLTERTPWAVRIRHADGAGPDAPAWVHTDGLARCGRPELEMLEVPLGRAAAAAVLVDEVANLLFDAPPPAPGVPLAIGPELAVVLQPWAEVARYVEAGTPGAQPRDIDDRARAAVCAERPEGTYRRLWGWPAGVVARIERGAACLFTTTRATQRRTAAATSTWPVFLAALEGRAGAHERVQFEVSGRVTGARGGVVGPAHAWYRVHAVHDATLDVEPLSGPAEDTNASPGALDVADVTDWRIVIPGGLLGPEAASAVPRVLAELLGEEVAR